MLAAWQIMTVCVWAISAQAQEDMYALVPIEAIGPERLSALQAEPGLFWWVELEKRLLIETDAATLARLQRDWGAVPVPREADQGVLAFAYLGKEGLPKGTQILVREGHLAVVRTKGPGFPQDPTDQLCRHGHTRFFPFAPNVTLLGSGANRAAPDLPRDPSVQELVDFVDGTRWHADVTTLTGYNRYTHGSGVLAARDWLVAQFSTLPGLEVSTPSFQVGGTTAYNVMARLPGTNRPNDVYIVGAHYDAISQDDHHATAPGAEDNGSGTAAVLEMARVFTTFRPESTVLFICYSGEEQGLFGSSAHASGLVSNGTSSQVKAALIMDMIGYAVDPDVRKVLLETGNAGSFLFTPLSQAAAQYTDLDTVTSLNPFGSDHVPYLNRGMPALLTIENDWDSYPDYHRSGDLPANVQIPMGAGIIKMNVATLAELAGLGAADASFSQYTAAWNEEVGSSQLRDINSNGLVDVLDLVARLNRL